MYSSESTLYQVYRPLINDFSERGYIRNGDYYFINRLIKPQPSKADKPKTVNKPPYDADEIDEPPDLDKDPDYWKNPEPKRKVKYPGIPRNASCPCGALHPDGRPKKYKHCCGK